MEDTRVELSVTFTFSPRLNAEDLIRYLEGKGYVEDDKVKSDNYKVYYLEREWKEDEGVVEISVPILDQDKEYELQIVPFFYQLADYEEKDIINVLLDIAKKTGRSLSSGKYVFMY